MLDLPRKTLPIAGCGAAGDIVPGVYSLPLPLQGPPAWGAGPLHKAFLEN